jgi:mRNA interferase RelE/StbE
MIYKIIVSPIAAKSLKSLPQNMKKRIDAKISALAKNPRPADVKILRGELGLFRVRVGDYRIIYKIKDDRLLVLIVKIGHRKDVYRQ